MCIRDSCGAAGFRRYIEKIKPICRALKNLYHCLNQFAHMQVWLFLRAIAKHFQFGRIPFQFLEKVIDDTMCGATANDVWKPTNPSVTEKLFHCGADGGF